MRWFELSYSPIVKQTTGKFPGRFDPAELNVGPYPTRTAAPLPTTFSGPLARGSGVGYECSMQVTEIAFTGYSVTDMKRAKTFYEGLLGLKRSRGFGQHAGDEQWVEYDIGPGCLALIYGGKDWPPSTAGTAAALEVDDFQGYVTRMRDSGVKFVLEPMETPMCWTAVVADPDGNRVALHHRKQTPQR
jgi:predicted enzyme related to lactoylglutathione lyase